MKSNKNIDYLFQEKLKGLEVAPPDIVWEKIEDSLNNKKRRRVIPIWFRLGGAAAVLLLISIAGVSYFSNSNVNANQDIIISNTNESNSDEIVLPDNDIDTFKKPIVKPPSDEEIIVLSTKDKVNGPTINSTPIHKNSSKSIQYKNMNASEKRNNYTIEKETNKEKRFDHTKAIDSSSKSLITKNNKQIGKDSNNNTAIITELDKEKDEEVNSNEEPVIVFENLIDTLENPLSIPDEDEEVLKNNKKWSVAPIVGPVFFNTFSKNASPIDSKFNNSSIQSEPTVSFGVKVNYSINNKLTFQSGVNIVSLSYFINDVFISTGVSKNIAPSINSIIVDLNPFDAPLVAKGTSKNNAPVKGALNQEFGYIEIPLELKYNVIDGKLGLNIVGGFSSLILNENNIFVETEIGLTDFGGASNLNDVNFTGNIGVDIDYEINKNMFINIAPTLKIQANTFSKNAEGFKPYFIGVYTGLNYKF